MYNQVCVQVYTGYGATNSSFWPNCNAQLLFISTEDFNSTELKSGSSTLLRVRVFSYCPPAASGVELNARTAGMYEDVRSGSHLILVD